MNSFADLAKRFSPAAPRALPSIGPDNSQNGLLQEVSTQLSSLLQLVKS